MTKTNPTWAEQAIVQSRNRDMDFSWAETHVIPERLEEKMALNELTLRAFKFTLNAYFNKDVSDRVMQNMVNDAVKRFTHNLRQWMDRHPEKFPWLYPDGKPHTWY